ncbi:MAG: VWA domain-containing protein [Acidobacteriota bacterium]
MTSFRASRPTLAVSSLLAALCLVLGLALAAASPSHADNDDRGRRWVKERLEALPEKYKQWLQDVSFIISDDERVLFLELDKDYQRDAFIERFWQVRDPYPRSARNEYREDYENRLRDARQFFGTNTDDRTKVLLTNGFPVQRLEVRCRQYLVPTEVWYYDGSERFGGEFYLLFYQRYGRGPFRLWEPFDGFDGLSTDGSTVSLGGIRSRCGYDGEAVILAINFLRAQGGTLGGGAFVGRITQQPEPPEREWIASFHTTSTDLPEGVATFPAELLVDYVGRNQSRTIVQGTLGVPKDAVKPSELASSYDFVLNGEILQDGKLFDAFRYQFGFGQAEVGATIPLVFQRYLRPGEYTLMLRVEDVASGAFHRSERSITVPTVEREPPPPSDPEVAKVLEEANAAIRSGETTVKIAQLPGVWQTGLVRIDALTTGDDAIDRVVFMLDDTPILTKTAPPWNVELDLGEVPRSRVLRVAAFDADGEELAADERMLNAGDHRFAVRLEEPRRNKRYRRSLRAEIDVIVPKGETVERVELYLNEEKLATLYQPPWVHPVVLPEQDGLAYVRAVAHTPDGRTTEDLVFVNAPENLEEIDVDFVEVYAAALDRDQRPVDGLAETDFRVLEDGTPQELVRFEKVENLPIHVAVTLDVSASMDEQLGQAQAAALTFFEQAVQPKDRATLVTFNDHPNLVVDFTNEVDQLAGGLAGLKAERGTALHDALIFTLYYFNGIRGQRAVLLLSDGEDESSRFDYDDVLEYARRAGVSIYTIGLNIGRTQLDTRRKLSRIADETGARAFFVDDAAELQAIYSTIERELRSRYLLAYQSSNTRDDLRFREITVETPGRSGIEVKAMRGYFP